MIAEFIENENLKNRKTIDLNTSVDDRTCCIIGRHSRDDICIQSLKPFHYTSEDENNGKIDKSDFVNSIINCREEPLDFGDSFNCNISSILRSIANDLKLK